MCKKELGTRIDSLKVELYGKFCVDQNVNVSCNGQFFCSRSQLFVVEEAMYMPTVNDHAD